MKIDFLIKVDIGFTFAKEALNLRAIISEDKSKLPDLSDELFKHFLRGVFDGDGCISIDSRPEKMGYAFRSGTFLILFNYIEHAEYCMKFIARLAGVNETKIVTKYGLGNVPVYQIKWSGTRNLIKIKDFIYSNSTISMDRKMNKFNLIKVGDNSTSQIQSHANRRHLHYIIKNCPVCDVQFERPKYKQSNCCSHICATKHRWTKILPS